jgi:hypothetical protein
MLSEPEVPVQRIDFIYTTAPGVSTPCRSFYPGNLIPETPAQEQYLPPISELLMETTAASLQTLAASNHPSAVLAYAAWISAQTSPPLPPPSLIFTHGRSIGLDDSSIIPFLTGFARTHPVLCFEDLGDLNTRAATFRSLLNHFPSATALGGRSKGGRASARAQLYSSAKQLIFLTYPLVRGTDERYDELLSLEPGTDVLFITGDADPLCVELHLRGVRERMLDRGVRSWWVKIVGGNHKLDAWAKERSEMVCNVVGQVAAGWMSGRDAERTELVCDWDKDRGVPTLSAWMPYARDERAPMKLSVRLGAGGCGVAEEILVLSCPDGERGMGKVSMFYFIILSIDVIDIRAIPALIFVENHAKR